MKRTILLTAGLLSVWAAFAQPCDPSTAPDGLMSTYIPSSGVLLQWNAVPSSVGVVLRATTPDGANVARRLLGANLDEYAIPESRLSPGTYIWQIQAACSTTPPYGVTPISSADVFTVGAASGCPTSVTDVEGNTYPVVDIGGECWMAENLRTQTYRDGSSIPTGPWNLLGDYTGAAVPYNGDPANIPTYGMLYNWYAVDEARGICPTGWHVPSEMDWDDAVNEQEPFTFCATCVGWSYSGNGGSPLKSSASDSPSWNGTNASGFSAIPAGYRDVTVNYLDQGFSALFWTSTEEDPNNGWYRWLFQSQSGVSRSSLSKRYGMSVRCVQD